jgi:predicted protein tyrosine phosphatase
LQAIPESVHDAFNLISAISSDIVAGKGVLVHCRQGVGRAGMIAACVLLRLGSATDATSAIQHVRRHRHKQAVQTARQEQFVHWYAANMMVSPISSLPNKAPFASRAYNFAAANLRRSSNRVQTSVDAVTVSRSRRTV